MTDDVIISITGNHHTEFDQDKIQLIQRGKYKYMQGKHIIHYKEIDDDSPIEPKTVDNILKIYEDKVMITKLCGEKSVMFFEKDRSYDTFYATPMGSIPLSIATTALDISDTPQELLININYHLNMNCQHVGSCKLTISVKPVEES